MTKGGSLASALVARMRNAFSYPVETFESISVGTINILECLRLFKRPARFYSAGSREKLRLGNLDICREREALG